MSTTYLDDKGNEITEAQFVAGKLPHCETNLQKGRDALAKTKPGTEEHKEAKKRVVRLEREWEKFKKLDEELNGAEPAAAKPAAKKTTKGEK